jgi:WD40 repeat protein
MPRYFLTTILLIYVFSLISIGAEYGPATSTRSLTEIESAVAGSLDLGNSNVEQTAVTIAKDYPGEYSIDQVCEIFNTLIKGWFYFSDPSYANKYKNSDRTLQDGKISNTIGMGNCDDFAILMSSLIASLGGSTRITFASNTSSTEGHAYSEVFLGNENDSHVDEIINWIKAKYNLTEVPSLSRDNGEVWLNLDWWAKYPGGPYFEEGEQKTVVWQSDKLISPSIIPIIDTMDSVSGWNILKDDSGSNISINSYPARSGLGIGISYNPKEEAGPIGIFRNLTANALSQVEGLKFSCYSMDEQITVEIRLAYDDGTEFGYTWMPALGKWQSIQALYDDFRCIGTGNKRISTEIKLDPGKAKKLEFLILNQTADKAGFIIFDHVQGVMNIPVGSAWAEAERRTREILATRVIDQAEDIDEQVNNAISLKVLLAAEATQIYPCWQADRALMDSMMLLPKTISQIPLDAIGHSRPVSGRSWMTRADKATQREMKAAFDGFLQIPIISSNGCKLAVASNDNEVLAIDMLTGHKYRLINSGYLEDIEFSANGSIMAIAGDDGTAMICNATSGRISANLSHETAVTEVSFSMDGKRLASVTKDNIMHFWDLSSSKELARIDLKNKLKFTNKSKSSWFELSTDGSKAAFGLSSDKSVTFCDTDSGKEMFKLYGDGVIDILAFSPTGTEIAAASSNGTILIWDLALRKLLTQKAHAYSVKKIAFSQKGDMLAVATSDNLIDIWNWKSSSSCKNGPIVQLSAPINSMKFSPDGTKLVTAGSDNAGRVWDTESGKELKRVEHNGTVRDAAFMNGSWLATISDDDTARLSEIDTGENPAKMQYEEPVQSVSFSPDGTGLITNRYKQIYKVTYIDINGRPSTFYELTLRHESLAGYRVEPINLNKNSSLWNLISGLDINISSIAGGLSSSAFSFIGSRIAGAVGSESIVLDVASGEEVSKIDNGCIIDRLSLSTDGSILVAANNSTATIWDVITRQKLAEIKHNSSINSIAFSPNGSLLATASNDNTCRIWDISGKELDNLEHSGPVFNSIFTADGSRLVTKSMDITSFVPNSHDAPDRTAYVDDGSDVELAEFSAIEGPIWHYENAVSVWDISSGTRLAKISEDSLTNLIFSPSKLITAEDDNNGNIIIHDAVNGSEVGRIQYKVTLLSLEISPDGSCLALGCDDGTARVWNLSDGREMASLKHKSPVIALAFSPDGSKLATGIQDGTASVWLWRSGDLVKEACSRLNRNLTPDEWRMYMGDEPYHETCTCQRCRN